MDIIKQLRESQKDNMKTSIIYTIPSNPNYLMIVEMRHIIDALERFFKTGESTDLDENSY